MTRFLAWAALAVLPSVAAAESADHYRGGWMAPDGAPQIYEFVIDGGKVTGFACTHCADAGTVMPLEGTFVPERGIEFTIRHLALDGTRLDEDRLSARLEGGKLVVREGSQARTLVKDPRGPAPSFLPSSILPPDAVHPPQRQRPAGAAPAAPASPPAPYVDPGEWRQLTPADVIGVWIGFGTGMDKQYFIIRPDDRGGLYGLACGPCDNPYTMGALENFRIEGDTVHFDINHQDWGEGPHLPFSRHVAARIGMNELRMDATRDDWPEDRGIVASLLGPVALEATKGNVVADQP